MIDSLLDTVLDRSVLGGYTNLGYRVRARSWDELPRMDGKVVLVTGASSGLGRAAAGAFARLGATIWLLARDRVRGEEARAQVCEWSAAGEVHLELADLSALDSVRQAAGRIRKRAQRLDVLVNNAGALTARREHSIDGIELTLATNVIGPFLFTNLLVPLLEFSAPARIINVSSGGMYTQRLQIDDLQSEQGDFDGAAVYARSKRAQVVLTELWAQRLAGTGIVVHAMHPGWSDTPGLRASLPRFHRLTRPLLRTPAEGADTIAWLGAAEAPGHSSGQFWHDRRSRPTHLLPRTRETAEDQEQLWAQCATLSGWREQRGRPAVLGSKRTG